MPHVHQAVRGEIERELVVVHGGRVPGLGPEDALDQRVHPHFPESGGVRQEIVHRAADVHRALMRFRGQRNAGVASRTFCDVRHACGERIPAQRSVNATAGIIRLERLGVRDGIGCVGVENHDGHKVSVRMPPITGHERERVSAGRGEKGACAQAAGVIQQDGVRSGELLPGRGYQVRRQAVEGHGGRERQCVVQRGIQHPVRCHKQHGPVRVDRDVGGR